MSSRIEKSRSARSASKARQKNGLLSLILRNAVEMPACSRCESRNIESCQASSLDSSRCAECVRLNLSGCDVLSLDNSADLLAISSQHQKIEDEIEHLEEKLLRLRKQKKMWREKMSRAIRRGLKNLEELERVEAEETEAERRRVAADVQAVISEETSISRPDLSFDGFDWNSVDVGSAVVDWSGFLPGPSEVVASGSVDTGQASQNSSSSS